MILKAQYAAAYVRAEITNFIWYLLLEKLATLLQTNTSNVFKLALRIQNAEVD
jgi:hypothetical protein